MTARATILAVGILVAILIALVTAQGATNPDVIFFDVSHVQNTANAYISYINGYLTCNRADCSTLTDAFYISMSSNVDEKKINPNHLYLAVTDHNGVMLSTAPLNHVLKMNQEVKMVTKDRLTRNFVKDETVYFSGRIEWYHADGTSPTTDVKITFGYGNDAVGISRLTRAQKFYTATKKSEYLSARDWNSVTKEFDFKAYIKTPDFTVGSFEVHPFGPIMITDEALFKCEINSLPMNVTISYFPADLLKTSPHFTLTVPSQHQLRYNSWQGLSDLEISCGGGMTHLNAEPTSDRFYGLTVLSQNKDLPNEYLLHYVLAGDFIKSWKQQVPAMQLYDKTVIPQALHHYEYLTRHVDLEDGEAITYSYNTVDFLLNSVNHTFDSNKSYLMRLNNLHGGAIKLIRYALTVQDSNGNWLPYTNTGKLTIDYYMDGSYCEVDAFSPSVTDIMKKTMDPTKPAKLTITFILSFKSNPPKSVIPTSMLGIKQTVHFNSLIDRSVLSWWSFVTPSTQKKAFVVDTNFYSGTSETDSDDERSSPSGEDIPLWDHKTDIKVVPYHSFYVELANVQYNDGERPQQFSIRIPTREYNFGGNTLNCTINDAPLTVLDPVDKATQIQFVNHPSLTFDFSLIPTTQYNITCPYIFLTNSSHKNNNNHGDKDVFLQFIAESPEFSVNDYYIIGGTTIDFPHAHHHDDGVAFSIAVLVTMGTLFAAIIVYIIYNNKYRTNVAETEQSESGHVQGDYGQFNDQEKH